MEGVGGMEGMEGMWMMSREERMEDTLVGSFEKSSLRPGGRAASMLLRREKRGKGVEGVTEV